MEELPRGYGSYSTLNVGRGGGAPEEHLELFHTSVVYKIGDFTVTVLASRHSKPNRFNNDLGQQISKPLRQPANCLFYVERQLKAVSFEERKTMREERKTPIWDAFFRWEESIEPVGGSKFQKAVTYALNHKETLQNYMLDGRCEISNNAAERKAKSYAIEQLMPWSSFIKEHCSGLVDV